MWIDVEQNSEEWFDYRLGRITSSNFALIMANCTNTKGDFNPKLAFGLPAQKYAQAKALERVTGKRRMNGYRNPYMEDGNFYESVAKDAYEAERFIEVTNGGFNHLGWVGDSPDGNIGADGCVEIKSVISDTQWERLKKGGYDKSYKWQIQGHIWLGEKQWCDFISYCHSDEFLDSKRLYIFRVERDEKMIHQLIERINLFNKLIEENIKILTN